MKPISNALLGGLNRVKWACVVFALGAAAAIALPAQTSTTLFSFDSTDGARPYAGLVQATNGDLYGVTAHGGAYGFGDCFVGNCGTIFKLTPSGTLTTLYSFCAQSGCVDGSEPFAALVQAADGTFYGTTAFGGANYNGTVFKLDPGRTPTTIYTFCAQGVYPDCTDGAIPYAGLVGGTNGEFYGTTFTGGANGSGTIFKITPGGALTTLYSFCAQRGCPDGTSPYAALVQATNGDLYGTTSFGGDYSIAEFGGGTVFKITPSGALTTLHTFCVQRGCPDGAQPYGALVQADDGNFYGTTLNGGANGDHGTVFKVTPGGTPTTLYSFCAQSRCTDGEYPQAGLVLATDGNFYGTAFRGGANGVGSVFRITTTGALTTLVSFDGTDGARPWAGLVQATNGEFYGTTHAGGAGNYGTVFGLSVGLGPFVKTMPKTGHVGQIIDILGTSLTGATSVGFNGTAAVFSVVSPSLITATVPGGATTGKIEVATPGGTLFGGTFFVLP